MPEYSDRAGWDALTQGSKKSVVKFAEQYLGGDWKAAPTSNKHREALSNLILGELFEGKGRFIPEISNALTAVCERGIRKQGFEESLERPDLANQLHFVKFVLFQG